MVESEKAINRYPVDRAYYTLDSPIARLRDWAGHLNQCARLLQWPNGSEQEDIVLKDTSIPPQSDLCGLFVPRPNLWAPREGMTQHTAIHKFIIDVYFYKQPSDSYVL